MKSTKALVISSSSTLVEHASQVIRRTLNSESVFHCTADNSIEALCKYQPMLVVMDTACTIDETKRLAETIWSIEPNVRIVFHLSADDKHLVSEMQEYSSVSAFVLNTHDSHEKLRIAVQAVCVFANNYCDASLRQYLRPIARQRTISHQAPGTISIALTEAERETLGDLLLGLTDKAIANKRHLSVRGVQSRLDRLAKKLCRSERRDPASGSESYNLRARMIFQALKRGIFSLEEVIAMENAS